MKKVLIGVLMLGVVGLSAIGIPATGIGIRIMVESQNAEAGHEVIEGLILGSILAAFGFSMSVLATSVPLSFLCAGPVSRLLERHRAKK